MDRCPCCNARLRELTKCPRCQADLSAVMGSELSAQIWLSKAIQYWLESKTEQSIEALVLSIGLKKTKLAMVFRGFLIKHQYQYVLDLLAQKQLLPAKQRLYKLRLLFPYSQQLQQINLFTDYLWVNDYPAIT